MQNAKSSLIENEFPVKFTEKEYENFWSKVEKTRSCWVWKGGTRAFRYGNFRFRGVLEASHRISYVIHGGKITKEKPCVLHNCPNGDNGFCINPDHLWAGTQKENILDMEKKGRSRHPAGNNNGMRTCPESILKGSKKPNAKLNEKQVIQIRKLCANGKRGIKIKLAKRFGVSHGLIGHIIHGRNWNHTLKYAPPANLTPS